MEIDLELYRQEVPIAGYPPIQLSVIDVYPEGAQRTFVFLHGFGGQARQWQHQIDHFSTTNRVVALDLRGHGRSDKPYGAYSMEEILNDLRTTLAALNVETPFVLVGHSFGGAIAAEFAAIHPKQVERLILIASAGEYHLNSLYRLLLRLPLPVLQSLVPMSGRQLGAPPHVLKAMYSNTVRRWRGWHLYRSLRMPTILIRGHLDRVFSKSYFDGVAQSIPNSVEVDVGASGHLVMLERREAVNRAIARFVEPEENSWLGGDGFREDKTWTRMLRERPWLPRYDTNVPPTIAVPRAPLYSLLHSATRRFPHRAAIRFEGSQVPYRRLYEESNRFANALIHLGVQKGDRVMLILPNLPQLVIAYWGALKAGAVVVFTLPTTQPEELVRQIQHADAKVLVTLTQFDELIHAMKQALEPADAAKLKHIIFTHIADYLPLHRRLALWASPTERQRHLLDIPLDATMHRFNQLLDAHSKEAPQVNVSAEDLAVIQYTGGTTDPSKGVMLSHRSLAANTLQIRHWIPEAEEGQERILCAVPFAHSYGLTTGLNLGIALGATLILKPQFEASDLLETIQVERPTIFPGTPQIFIAIKDFPGVRRFGVESIKACFSGTAPLPVEVQEAFEKLTRSRLLEVYGLTEASSLTHANPFQGPRKTGSIGLPLPSTEARIVDLRRGRKEMPPGQMGELAVRGPQIMSGYWKDEQATQETLANKEWLLTGDVALMDNEGYFRIIARKADMWYPDRPDSPASSRQVEEVLYEIPQVKEAAVIPIAGQPVAFVIAHAERPSAEAIISYCKRRLPPEFVPRLVIFVDDFPRTFIGRVVRRELAKRFEESRKSESEAGQSQLLDKSQDKPRKNPLGNI